MLKNNKTELHQQEIDFKIIEILLPYLKNKTFLDIGAEKGSFTRLCMKHKFHGTLFEPLPKHADILKNLTKNTSSTFLPFAIDKIDREAEFHIACDLMNQPLDYFHSLHELKKDKRVKHTQSISVKCRSLNSLAQEGIIQNKIGVIKIDTDGNDLHVLKGTSEIDAEVLMCEFFMPGIYAGWEQGDPNKLIKQAKLLGFNHYIAIKRMDYYESISIDKTRFINKQWGNLIFIKNEIFTQAEEILRDLLADKELEVMKNFKQHNKILANEANALRKVCQERLELINELHTEFSSNIRYNAKLLINDLQQFSATLQKTFEQSSEAITLSMINEAIKQLNDKYSIIFQQKDKLIEYQAGLLTTLDINSLKNKINRFRMRIKNFFTPKLGTLIQHPPRQLHFPRNYFRESSSKNLPTISIVTPSFNQSQFLERTIISIITQEYPNLEYIIQDGGSDEKTLDILKKYQPVLKHWESTQDKGQSHALNLGFRHATGEIMAYLNSDDILLPGSLNYIAQFFAKNPSVDVVYGHRILINEKDQEIGRWILPKHDEKILSWADYVPQETLFWRRSAWEKIGGEIDETFNFAMDWDLILRFKETGAKFFRLPRFLGAFRIHAHQKTSAQINLMGFEEMQRIRESIHGRKISQYEVQTEIRSYLFRHVIHHVLYRFKLLHY